ncbi:c-type cytochrome [Ramlibacter sp. PS3R-8]|uniref:c-type cytochrome n=1 Tax=Ramlibacter sp. PS3R-8 TaxID=3133437 RepID=UPI00309EA5B0
MSDSLEEAHTGPIKTPKQLLIAVLFSFLVPVFAIIALVAYVAAENKPAGGGTIDKYVLGGVTAQDLERGVAERIRKVGSVEIRDANRPLANGEAVFKAQCTACHTAGVAGAPKLGDAASWANRLKTGFDALVQSALKGKGAMPPQAGGDFNDVEVARAVAYMANSAGAKFAEPAAPAAPATTAAAAPGATAAAPAAPMAAPVAAAAPAAAPVAVAAAAPAAAGPAVAAAGNGEAVYKQACFVCHGAGVAGAPKIGDKAAWAPRLAQGLPALHASALKGKGAMPPKGGSPAPDADIKAAVDYMVGTVK